MNRKHFTLFLVLIISVSFSISCSAVKTKLSTFDSEVLHEDVSTEINVGDKVAIILEEAPSMTQLWYYLIDPPELLNLVEDKSFSNAIFSFFMGVSYTRILKYVAIFPGEVKLDLWYYNMSSKKIVDRKKFQVIIAE